MHRTLLLTLLIPGAASAANSFTAKVVGVSSGDTITVLRANKTLKIRLHGVDCPERNQPYGKKARQLTRELVFGKRVKVEPVMRRHGRTVARVFVPSTRKINPTPNGKGSHPYQNRPVAVVTLRLGAELLRAGLAWHYMRYDSTKKLADLQREACEVNRGLWADAAPIAPWLWRKGKRQSKSLKDVLSNLPRCKSRRRGGKTLQQRAAQTPAAQKGSFKIGGAIKVKKGARFHSNTKSKERVCKVNRDCVLVRFSSCGCPPCDLTNGRVVNRATHRRLHTHWSSTRSCPPTRCAKCRTKAKPRCVNGQCIVR